ncbi:hypothetical protein [Methanobrevibacter sp.]|uniref:hypothetical protein n=1 Tax=Methanobrevibacter sp. TaxID=66852 RepID=UPI003D7DBE73
MYTELDIAFIVILEIIGILFLTVGFSYIKNKIVNHRELQDRDKILPQEELETLQQVFYLIMGALLLLNVLNFLFFENKTQIELVFLDIFVSVISCMVIYDKGFNKLVLIGLMPLQTLIGMTYLYFGISLNIRNDVNMFFFVLTLIHVVAGIYFTRYYFKKFLHFTKVKGLGYTAVLLFIILGIAFVFTIFTEGTGVLDSVVMVSNAFTSNGYAILGNSSLGKFTDVVLVWSGYVLSSVGTATLSFALLKRYFDRKINKLEEEVKKQSETNEKLIELIEKQND